MVSISLIKKQTFYKINDKLGYNVENFSGQNLTLTRLKEMLQPNSE